MAQHLIVTRPFGDYAKGDRISDAATVTAIRAGHNAHSVVPITVPDEIPAAAPASAPAAAPAPAA